jgi:hypothetical protein
MNESALQHRWTRPAAWLGCVGLVLLLGAAAAPSSPPVPITRFPGVLYGVSAVSGSDVWAAGVRYRPPVSQTLLLRWNGRRWVRTASPNPGTERFLLAVSAVSRTDAWAVGSYDTSTAEKTLALHWNGTTWAQVPTPDPGAGERELDAVSAVSGTDAWATGHYATTAGVRRTLALHWNGTSWAQVPTPDPGAGERELGAVSAVSGTDAWAAGYYVTSAGAEDTLMAHWNGAAWTQVPSPDPGGSFGTEILGVSALSGSDAWATGDYGAGTVTKTLALRWNGTTWAQVPTPSPGGINNILDAVSAHSPNDAWAVGIYVARQGVLKTLAAHWNGSAWRQVPSPDPGGILGTELNGVSALSGTHAWAAGDSATTVPSTTLLLRWNGTRWTRT